MDLYVSKMRNYSVGETLSRVSSRCAYEGVGEVSIYVDPKYQKQLVGEKPI